MITTLPVAPRLRGEHPPESTIRRVRRSRRPVEHGPLGAPPPPPLAFALARRIARWHHENFDGTGYPDGIAGIHIPVEARIVRVADAFDAITHTRPYQRARSVEEALEELDRWAGRQFDPELVRLQIELVRGASSTEQYRLAPRILPVDNAVQLPSHPALRS